MITKAFSKLGRLIARPQNGDWRAYARQGRIVDFTMLFFLLAVIGIGFYSPIINFFNDSFSAAPNIAVSRNEWKALYESGPNCDAQNICYANLDSLLWKSTHRLSDTDYTSRASKMLGQRFWVGTSFSPNMAKEIASISANHFVIGHINAPFQIYINGEKRLTGNGKDFLPITILLTKEDFNKKHGLSIAIELNHSLGSAWPIAVGAPNPTGFFSDLKAKDFRNLFITTAIIRPISLALAGFIIFSIFFFLWMSVKDRSEYLAYALFALCLFCTQLMHWGVIKHTLLRNDVYLLDLALRFSEGVFAGALGFTYARTRKELTFAAIFSGIIIFGICYQASNIGRDFLIFSVFLAKFYVPTLYALAAFSCFASGEFCHEISQKKGGDAKLDTRSNRLYIFGSFLFILGALYFIDAFKILGLNSLAVWHRPIQLSIVALIGTFILRDYREFDFIMETSVQSRFHNPRAKEQKVFKGTMIHLDLKSSSALYNYSAKSGLATKLPTLWCEGAIQIIKKYGGEHLSSSGDSFFAFFQGESAENIAEHAFSSLEEIEAFTKEFSLEYNKIIAFRAVVLSGAIKPIYKTVSGKRFEDYEDAPGETLFKDASRFLEAEKNLGRKSESILVVEESLQFVAEKFFPIIKSEKLSVRDVGTRKLCFFLILTNRQDLEKAIA